MKIPPFFLFCLLLCGTLLAQPRNTTNASVDKTTILIGEPLQLTLQATFSNTHAPSFFTIDSLPHFEILNKEKIDTQALNGQTILEQKITLTSWDSGAWSIPALAIAGVKGVTTKPLQVSVTFTPTPPNQEYHDIKDIIEVQPPPRTTWYWYVAGALLLLLLLALVFPKTKKAPLPETGIIREGAYKQALKELDMLKQHPGSLDTDYFTALIHIFRTYLQQGKGIHSFQQTTGDLSRQLQALALPHEDLKKLEQTLQLSDFVKIAQYHTTAAERENAWEEIRKSIVAIEQLPK